MIMNAGMASAVYLSSSLVSSGGIVRTTTPSPSPENTQFGVKKKIGFDKSGRRSQDSYAQFPKLFEYSVYDHNSLPDNRFARSRFVCKSRTNSASVQGNTLTPSNLASDGINDVVKPEVDAVDRVGIGSVKDAVSSETEEALTFDGVKEEEFPTSAIEAVNLEKEASLEVSQGRDDIEALCLGSQEEADQPKPQDTVTVKMTEGDSEVEGNGKAARLEKKDTVNEIRRKNDLNNPKKRALFGQKSGKDTWQRGEGRKLQSVPHSADPDVEYFEPQIGDQVLGLVVRSTAGGAQLDIGAKQLAKLTVREGSVVVKIGDESQGADLHVVRYESLETGGENEVTHVAEKIGIIACADDIDLALYTEPHGQVETSPAEGDEERTSGGDRGRLGLVEVGSILRVEVVGETILGDPLVSLKKVVDEIAWSRIQQIMMKREPFKVRMKAISSGGLITRLEGLRAFIPMSLILDGPDGSLPDLASLVGTEARVMITEMNPATGRLVISMKAAAAFDEESRLKVGMLVDGEVAKLSSYGAFIKIDNTSRRGLIHISNISRFHTEFVEDVFCVGERVRALIILNDGGNIGLSTRDLESVDGLILRDKERVFEEAEKMAEIFREEIEVEENVVEDAPDDTICGPCANEAWFSSLVGEL